jgi:DUF4097 and DUF4098 domain-containing protein YvlB
MNDSRFRFGQQLALFAAIALTIAYSHPAQADAQGSFQRTLQVNGQVDLDITTGSGNIDVRTGQSNTVQITGKIRAHGWSGNADEKVRKLEGNPPIEQSGNSIRIGEIHDPELKRNVSISYEVVVPADTRLQSRTGSGDQKVDGIHGPLEANTGSGNVSITNVGNGVQAHTGSGDMRLENIKGDLLARTGSGGIRANGIAGGFDGESGSGDIQLDQTAAGEVRARAGSGDLELRGVQGLLTADTGSGDVTVDGTPKGSWRVTTGSGTVKVRVPADVGFNLDAHTSSGTISVDHPLTVQGRIGKRDLHGKVGNGGSVLEVKTGSGDIDIM